MALAQGTDSRVAPTTTSIGARIQRLLRNPRLFHGALGVGVFFLTWYLLVDVFGVWRFNEMPKLVVGVKEWVSRDPVFGVSLFTAEYYTHIWASVFRVLVAFLAATFSGIAIVGYDNFREEYSSYWIDSMTTAATVSSGPAGDDPRVIATEGTLSDAMRGDKKAWFKAVFRIVSENENVYEMYAKDPSGEVYKSMEIVCKRK